MKAKTTASGVCILLSGWKSGAQLPTCFGPFFVSTGLRFLPSITERNLIRARGQDGLKFCLIPFDDAAQDERVVRQTNFWNLIRNDVHLLWQVAGSESYLGQPVGQRILRFFCGGRPDYADDNQHCFPQTWIRVGVDSLQFIQQTIAEGSRVLTGCARSESRRASGWRYSRLPRNGVCNIPAYSRSPAQPNKIEVGRFSSEFG